MRGQPQNEGEPAASRGQKSTMSSRLRATAPSGAPRAQGRSRVSFHSFPTDQITTLLDVALCFDETHTQYSDSVIQGYPALI